MGRKKNKVWKYYREANRGNKQLFECIFCECTFGPKNATRKRDHLITCKDCPERVKSEFLEFMKKSGSAKNKDAEESDDSGDGDSKSDSESDSGNENKRPSEKKNMITTFMDRMSPRDQEKARQLFAKAILVTGVAVSKFEHVLWKNFFNFIRPAFRLPTAKTISNKYVEEEFETTAKTVQDKVDKAESVSIQVDGWSNIRNESIFNFIATTPEPVFLKFLQTGSERHYATYIDKEVEKVIVGIDSDKCFGMIGDNAKNLQKALKNLEEKYPHMVALNCNAHTAHLLCKDILTNSDTIARIMKDAVDIVKTVKNTQILSAVFAQIKAEKKIKVSLCLPGDTRWGSSTKCLTNLIKCKSALQSLAIDQKAAEVFAEKENIKLLIVKKKLWDEMEMVLSLLEPITDTIVKMETDTPKIHRLYDWVDKMITDLKNTLQKISTTMLPYIEKKIISAFISHRRKMMIKPIHYAAKILNPDDQGKNLNSKQLAAGLKFISKIAESTKGIDAVKVSEEYINFKNKSGDIFSVGLIWKKIKNCTPLNWWVSYGAKTDLSRIATRILSAPITSAATERSFSTFSIVHSKLRNRLTTSRAGKITYISQNWKLLNMKRKKRKKFSKQDEEEDDEDDEKDEIVLEEEVSVTGPKEINFNSNLNFEEENSYTIYIEEAKDLEEEYDETEFLDDDFIFIICEENLNIEIDNNSTQENFQNSDDLNIRTEVNLQSSPVSGNENFSEDYQVEYLETEFENSQSEEEFTPKPPRKRAKKTKNVKPPKKQKKK